MTRPLALLLSAALLAGQVSSAAPAFAQTYAGSGQAVPVAPIALAIPALPPAAAPFSPGTVASSVLAPGPSLITPMIVPASISLPAALAQAPAPGLGTASAAPLAAARTVAAKTAVAAPQVMAQAARSRSASTPGASPAEPAAASLERTREGLRPATDNASFLSTFWTGMRRGGERSGPDPVLAREPEAAASGLRPAEPRRNTPRSDDQPPAPRTTMAHGVIPFLAATWAGAGHALAKVAAIPWVHHAIPYALAAAVLAATKPAARFARKLADRMADRGKWDAGTRLLARHAAGWGTWLAGGLVAAHVAGVDPATLAKSLGITTLAMSLALKGLIGNVFQGAVLLVSRPFDIGDRVRLEDTEYRVAAMTLREVQLTKDGGKTIDHYTYAELASRPITIFKPYVSGRSSATREQGPSSAPRRAGGSGLWLAAAAVAAAGLAAAAPGLAFAQPWLLKAVPWLYAGAIGVATLYVNRAATRLVDRFARKRKWHANETMLARAGASAATFLLGTGSALRVLGVSWAALGASAGITGVVATIAATDLIESAIDSLTLLGTQPFTLGDRIQVGGHAGTVVDVTLRYVVIKLDGPGEAHTLIPVSKFSNFQGPGSRAGR